MDETLYEALAAHLDRLPGGFAPSRTGAHLRLLAYLFTPEEAALAVHLTLEPDAPAAIAARAGLPPGEVALRLEEMARKGLTLSSEGPEGLRYQALPWIVGIYEMQQNRLSTGFRRRVYSYWGSIEPRAEPDTLPQMRTIPVGEAIAFQPEAMAYQQVGALVEAQTYFAVQPCICRRMARLNGRGCDAPEEVCLAFGDWARYAVRTGRAREITREEVLDILELARAANLVLQPSNSRDVAFICCCCGCCCGILADLRRAPRPAEAVTNDYAAVLAPDLCANCGSCLERCPMGALTSGKEHVLLDADRCIGCGLCAAACPTGALQMALKPEERRRPVPETLAEAWQIIARERARERGLAAQAGADA